MSISDSDYQGRFTIPTPKGVYQAAGWRIYGGVQAEYSLDEV